MHIFTTPSSPQVLSLLDSWAAAYYAIQPVGSFFARYVSTRCMRLCSPTTMCSLSRLLFLSHLARFTIRVRCPPRLRCRRVPLTPHAAAAASNNVLGGCQHHVPMSRGCHGGGGRRRVDCECLLQRRALHVSAARDAQCKPA